VGCFVEESKGSGYHGSSSSLWPAVAMINAGSPSLNALSIFCRTSFL